MSNQFHPFPIISSVKSCVNLAKQEYRQNLFTFTSYLLGHWNISFFPPTFTWRYWNAESISKQYRIEYRSFHTFVFSLTEINEGFVKRKKKVNLLIINIFLYFLCLCTSFCRNLIPLMPRQQVFSIYHSRKSTCESNELTTGSLWSL